MAKQNYHPMKWRPGMGDGCSGVLDFNVRAECDRHDERYHYGGDVYDKLAADNEFYCGMKAKGFPWTWGLARIRHNGMRYLTYNYPPGHPKRREALFRIEAFNWLGPGMPA